MAGLPLRKRESSEEPERLQREIAEAQLNAAEMQRRAAESQHAATEEGQKTASAQTVNIGLERDLLEAKIKAARAKPAANDNVAPSTNRPQAANDNAAPMGTQQPGRVKLTLGTAEPSDQPGSRADVPFSYFSIAIDLADGIPFLGDVFIGGYNLLQFSKALLKGHFSVAFLILIISALDASGIVLDVTGVFAAGDFFFPSSTINSYLLTRAEAKEK